MPPGLQRECYAAIAHSDLRRRDNLHGPRESLGHLQHHRRLRGNHRPPRREVYLHVREGLGAHLDVSDLSGGRIGQRDPRVGDVEEPRVDLRQALRVHRPDARVGDAIRAAHQHHAIEHAHDIHREVRLARRAAEGVREADRLARAKLRVLALQE